MSNPLRKEIANHLKDCGFEVKAFRNGLSVSLINQPVFTQDVKTVLEDKLPEFELQFNSDKRCTIVKFED